MQTSHRGHRACVVDGPARTLMGRAAAETQAMRAADAGRRGILLSALRSRLIDGSARNG